MWEKIQKDEVNILDIWLLILKRRMLILSVTILSILVLGIYFALSSKLYEGEAIIGLVKTDHPLVGVLETKNLIEMSIKKWKNGTAPRGAEVTLAKKIVDVFVDEIPGSLTQIKLTIRVRGDGTDVKNIFEGLKTEMVLSDYATTYMEFFGNEYNNQIKEAKLAIAESQETKEKIWAIAKKTNKVTVDTLIVDAKINELRTKLLSFEDMLARLQNYKYDIGPLVRPLNSSAKIKLYLVIVGVCGFLTGLLLAFLLELKAQFKQT